MWQCQDADGTHAWINVSVNVLLLARLNTEGGGGRSWRCKTLSDRTIASPAWRNKNASKDVADGWTGPVICLWQSWLATILGTAVYRSLTCHWQQHWLVRRRRGDFTWTLPAACCAVLGLTSFSFFFCSTFFGCLFYKTLSAKSNTWIQVQCAPPPPHKKPMQKLFFSFISNNLGQV